MKTEGSTLILLAGIVMSVTLGDKVVAAAFVALMIVGSITAYLIVYDNLNDDPREESHEYTFEGTLYGSSCTGKGESRFIEHSGGLLFHTLDISVATETCEIERTLNLMFTEDGDLVEPCLKSGISVIDGEEVTEWMCDSDGIECMLFVADGCKILKVQMNSPYLVLIGCIQ